MTSAPPSVAEALESYHDEVQAAWLYEVVASCEHDDRLRSLFLQLRDAAQEQATLWSAQLGSTPAVTISWRARFVAWLVRRVGPRAARHALAALKVRGLSVYRLDLQSTGHANPQQLEDIGQRHRSVVGSNLRASVFGANDGLISNLSLILGVTGAAQGSEAVVIAGIAGWLAGATSMAAGEWISVRSQRELYEYQIGLERAELALYPEAEAAELAMIYQARGFAPEEARMMARTLTADVERAVEVLAREELGLNPDDLGSAWRAAVASFIAFSLGAWVPLVPLLVGLSLEAALPLAIGASAIALFGLGLTISLFTGRSALLGGLRMLVIGAAAGFLSYMAGDWINAWLLR